MEYQTQGTDWTLSVSDDGVGIPTGMGAAKPGLGSGIVEALARQLDARVTVMDADPGTRVSITHRETEPV